MRRLWCVAAWLASVLAFPQPFSDGVHVLDDLTARWTQGQASNALQIASARTVRSGGVAMRAGFLHPTTRPARLQFQVALPAVNPGDQLALIAWAGVDDNARRDDPTNPHDGVQMRLIVENQVAAEAECDTAGWQALSADLTPYAGRTISVAFEADPKRNANYDWAYFAGAQVVRLRERFALKVGRTLPPEGVLEVRGTAGDQFALDAPNHPPVRATIPPRGVVWLRYAFHGARSANLAELQPETVARVYPLQPRLRLETVAARRAVLTLGETTEVLVRLRNVGAGTWQNDRVQLSVQSLGDAEVLSRPEVEADLLPPDATVETRFRVRVGARPRLSVLMRSGAGNDAVLLTPVVALNTPSLPASGKIARAENGVGVLQNEQLRLIISPASSGGYAARLFAKQGDTWVPVASSAPLADAVLNAENAPPKPSALSVETITADAAALRLLVQGRMGLIARATLEYQLEGNRLRCTGRLVAEVNAHLYRFRFPDWRVGDGAFGDAKDEALFPGLEYLLGTERSSSAAFVAPPHEQRFAPDPYKITAPLMAVRWRNYLLSLEWDPAQGWSGVLRAPNALFASPNFLEGGANHRFALWVPSIPRWAEENTQQAREPFRFLKDDSVLLQATLVVRLDATDVAQAMEQYLQRVGTPYPPAPQRDDFGALRLTVQGLLNSFDAAQSAWRHTNTGPVFYNPEVALGLWVLGHRLFPEDMRRRRAVEQVRAAVDARPKGQHGLDVAFYVGGLPSALDEARRTVDALVKEQREDGSWAWRPETPRHALLGKAGDSSSGWTSRHATRVGRFACLSMAPDARESLLRSLRYLAKQRRPEGAQTWELPLHVPDLLAAAYAIHACLDGYLLTGESQWLAQARLWALRGTPFIYLWHTLDKPIMRGASIPAFGATWLNQQAWFGVAVQWNGLVYARALYRLATLDRTTTEPAALDWKRLADTITLCAVQQQEWVSDRRADREGFYPDAFNIPKNAEEYTWDLNPRLIAPCVAQRLGFTIEPLTQVVRVGNRLVACTAPGLQSVAWEDGTLRVQLNAPASDLPALYLLVAGVRTPVSVRLNGTPLPPVDDMDALIWQIPSPQSGWATHELGLLLRVVNPSTATVEVVD
ncbi:MAG: hypothetical protein NZ874_07110 [Fimbriimonadales bacterium]|nr:hypothetical protein [Fimbriimonadales bacterium]